MKKNKLTINEIVEIEANRLGEEDKKIILNNPDYIDYHFGYGMYLRNEYIHSGRVCDDELSETHLDLFPDDLSEIIFEKIVKKIREKKTGL